jgi:hypothetical protein
MAAYKNLHKVPDPLGIMAQVNADHESKMRADIRREEEQKVYAPLKATNRNPEKFKELPDPLGLRAHGMNPDGSNVKK